MMPNDQDRTPPVFVEKTLDGGGSPLGNVGKRFPAGVAKFGRILHEARVSVHVGVLDRLPVEPFPAAHVALDDSLDRLGLQAVWKCNNRGGLKRALERTGVAVIDGANCQEIPGDLGLPDSEFRQRRIEPPALENRWRGEICRCRSMTDEIKNGLHDTVPIWFGDAIKR